MKQRLQNVFEDYKQNMYKEKLKYLFQSDLNMELYWKASRDTTPVSLETLEFL